VAHIENEIAGAKVAEHLLGFFASATRPEKAEEDRQRLKRVTSIH
jgi:hypothetical protein